MRQVWRKDLVNPSFGVVIRVGKHQHRNPSLQTHRKDLLINWLRGQIEFILIPANFHICYGVIQPIYSANLLIELSDWG